MDLKKEQLDTLIEIFNQDRKGHIISLNVLIATNLWDKKHYDVSFLNVLEEIETVGMIEKITGKKDGLYYNIEVFLLYAGSLGVDVAPPDKPSFDDYYKLEKEVKEMEDVLIDCQKQLNYYKETLSKEQKIVESLNVSYEKGIKEKDNEIASIEKELEEYKAKSSFLFSEEKTVYLFRELMIEVERVLLVLNNKEREDLYSAKTKEIVSQIIQELNIELPN